MWNEIRISGAEIGSILKLEECPHASLIDAVIGTKLIRCGPRPTGENYDHLARVLAGCVDEHKPIRVLVGWGSAKGYGRYRIGVADLLDLMAIKRIACLHEHVKMFHAPGILATLFMEDYSGQLLRGNVTSDYHDSLVRLIDAIGLDFISVIRESELIGQRGFLGYTKIVRSNTTAILAGEQDKLGWAGEIAWDHYMARAMSGHPGLNEYDRKIKVSLYLGSTLARYQCNINPASDIRVAFVPYPASVPEALHRCRVEYKVRPSKHGHSSPAPWSCFGVLKPDGWGHTSVKEMGDRPMDIMHIRVNGVKVPALRGG